MVGKHKYICVFKWSCTGGSSEDWDISVTSSSSWSGDDSAASSAHNVECIVSRPNPPSYILFNSWELILKGPKKSVVSDVVIRDNDGELAEGTAYIRKKRKVRGKDDWNGSLTSLTIKAEMQ